MQPRSANNAACPNREPPSQLFGAITYARVTGQGGRESGRFIWGLWCGQVPLAVLHFHIICCFELLPPRSNNGTILQPAIRIWLGLLPHSAATNAPCTISATWAAAGHPYEGPSGCGLLHEEVIHVADSGRDSTPFPRVQNGRLTD